MSVSHSYHSHANLCAFNAIKQNHLCSQRGKEFTFNGIACTFAGIWLTVSIPWKYICTYDLKKKWAKCSALERNKGNLVSLHLVQFLISRGLPCLYKTWGEKGLSNTQQSYIVHAHVLAHTHMHTIYINKAVIFYCF